MPVTDILSGIISGIAGIGQTHKANKLLKGLTYPIESLPAEITQNQTLASEQANQGLPSQQYQMAMRNIQRQQLGALRGAQDRRGGLAALSSINQGTNDATLNLDALNAQARQQAQQRLMNVNSQTANWKSQLFQKNVRDKYNRDYDYAMRLKGMGQQNLYGGIDKAVSGGASLLMGGFGSGAGLFAG